MQVKPTPASPVTPSSPAPRDLALLARHDDPQGDRLRAFDKRLGAAVARVDRKDWQAGDLDTAAQSIRGALALMHGDPQQAPDPSMQRQLADRVVALVLPPPMPGSPARAGQSASAALCARDPDRVACWTRLLLRAQTWAGAPDSLQQAMRSHLLQALSLRVVGHRESVVALVQEVLDTAQDAPLVQRLGLAETLGPTIAHYRVTLKDAPALGQSLWALAGVMSGHLLDLSTPPADRAPASPRASFIPSSRTTALCALASTMVTVLTTQLPLSSPVQQIAFGIGAGLGRKVFYREAGASPSADPAHQRMVRALDLAGGPEDAADLPEVLATVLARLPEGVLTGLGIAASPARAMEAAGLTQSQRLECMELAYCLRGRAGLDEGFAVREGKGGCGGKAGAGMRPRPDADQAVFEAMLAKVRAVGGERMDHKALQAVLGEIASDPRLDLEGVMAATAAVAQAVNPERTRQALRILSGSNRNLLQAAMVEGVARFEAQEESFARDDSQLPPPSEEGDGDQSESDSIAS